jgi:hypothetical protein
MKIKDLIEKLKAFPNLDLEIAVEGQPQGLYGAQKWDTTNIDLIHGYMVCDEPGNGLLSINKGNGVFIEKGWGERIMCEDNKMFLDLSSPTTYPCLYLHRKDHIGIYKKEENKNENKKTN